MFREPAREAHDSAEHFFLSARLSHDDAEVFRTEKRLSHDNAEVFFLQKCEAFGGAEVFWQSARLAFLRDFRSQGLFGGAKTPDGLLKR